MNSFLAFAVYYSIMLSYLPVIPSLSRNLTLMTEPVGKTRSFDSAQDDGWWGAQDDVRERV
jgi:hypothetical protein